MIKVSAKAKDYIKANGNAVHFYKIGKAAMC